MNRPDWTVKRDKPVIDLSKNVHYDSLMNSYISELLNDVDIHDYPSEYKVYDAISKYYNIKLEQLAVGYGSSEVIERVLRALKIKKLYILIPTFEMIQVYCINNGIEYTVIEDLSQAVDPEYSLYIVNPNGNDGTILNLSDIYHKFDYCIIDEVYADFDDQFSLLKFDSEKLIIIKSLSKSLGIAGLRIGFCKASISNTIKIQDLRHSYITSSIAEVIVPNIISKTPTIVERMKHSKSFLESKFECIESHGNYVLFKKPNVLTDLFGCKNVNGLYRMALLDMETIKLYVKNI